MSTMVKTFMKREMSPVSIRSIMMKRMPTVVSGCTRLEKRYCIWIIRPDARKTCSGNLSSRAIAAAGSSGKS